MRGSRCVLGRSGSRARTSTLRSPIDGRWSSRGSTAAHSTSSRPTTTGGCIRSPRPSSRRATGRGSDRRASTTTQADRGVEIVMDAVHTDGPLTRARAPRPARRRGRAHRGSGARPHPLRGVDPSTISYAVRCAAHTTRSSPRPTGSVRHRLRWIGPRHSPGSRTATSPVTHPPTTAISRSGPASRSATRASRSTASATRSPRCPHPCPHRSCSAPFDPLLRRLEVARAVRRRARRRRDGERALPSVRARRRSRRRHLGAQRPAR